MQREAGKNFLFLQGPHGPFFWQLGQILTDSGASVWRVGFNAGDRRFWPDRDSYISFKAESRDWAGVFAELVAKLNITDIVLYGDTRPVHQTAIQIAKAAHLRTHVFEEGYLRPYWVTYERDGVNGYSRLMDMNISQMRRALYRSDRDHTEAPAHWGDLRQHVYYAVVYHWHTWSRAWKYPNFKSHRTISTSKEFVHYLRRLVTMPYTAVNRMIATRRIKSGGHPYHLALLQLEHDASFVTHSPFETMEQFIDMVIAGFVQGAPRHHRLVFKAHPLDNARRPYRKVIQKLARAAGVQDHVHYLTGGRLGALLDSASSAVAINSTAAQQALWRGLPVRAHGDAVYVKPELTSKQPLELFFAVPTGPDQQAYLDFRSYLLRTSQVPGSYYSASGRQQLLRRVVDMILSDLDPYDAFEKLGETLQQQLRVVK